MSGTARRFVMSGVVAALAVPLVVAAPADAKRGHPEEIVLPGATSAEGITLGRGHTFYAGELETGDIFAGDLRRGTAVELIDVPDGRMAVGMAFSRSTGLLVVAGGATGQGYVYDPARRTTVGVVPLADPAGGATFINDVAVTREGAWFTDSARAVLTFVPLSRSGPGTPRPVTLTGPAAELPGPFNLNGIAATPDGGTLVVAHSANGRLYTVDPRTGSSAVIAGIEVPNVDGIVLQGRRVWVVQNALHQVSVFRLAGDLRSGTLERVIRSPLFQFPTTAAIHGSTLAVVNAKFDEPDADRHEVVLVRR